MSNVKRVFRQTKRQVVSNGIWYPPPCGINLPNLAMHSTEVIEITHEIFHSRKRKHEKDPITDYLEKELMQGDGLHPLPTQCEIIVQKLLSHEQVHNVMNPEVPGKAANVDDISTIWTSVNELTGESLLHVAARMNAGGEAIRYLSKKIHILDEPSLPPILMLDNYGCSPLVKAASANAMESYYSLLKVEKDAINRHKQAYNMRSSNCTSNLAAPFNGRIPNKDMDERRITPLIGALRSCSSECANAILDEGFIMRREIDEFGRNAVHWAAALDNGQILKRLMQNKLSYKFVNVKDDLGYTPLMLAIREGAMDSLMVLLDHAGKFEFDVEDAFDNNPIDIARQKGFDDIVQLLLDQLPNLVQTINECGGLSQKDEEIESSHTPSDFFESSQQIPTPVDSLDYTNSSLDDLVS